MKKWMILCWMMVVSGMVLAQEFDAREDSAKELNMPQIEILTQRDRILSKVPGSVAVIDFRSIKKIAPMHGNELFRKIPGLNVVVRGRFMVNGATAIADTNVVASNKLLALIPGWGFNYSLDDAFTLFGGIHRGFAPPRTKDAITAEGIALDIAQEDSWNSELGMRALLGKFAKAEFTLFRMEFKNQIIPVSQSSGNANATGLANGGKTSHFGLEAGASVDLAKQMKKNFSLVFAANATWIDSRYSANRFIVAGTNKVNVKNNQLPYAPSLMLNHSIEFESAKGAGIRLSGNFVGKQFADELNTIVASADGRNGLLASRYITDLSAFARLSKKQVLFSLAVKNLINERYIASRRPQGIRVGIDRQIVAGIELKW